MFISQQSSKQATPGPLGKGTAEAQCRARQKRDQSGTGPAVDHTNDRLSEMGLCRAGHRQPPGLALRLLDVAEIIYEAYVGHHIILYESRLRLPERFGRGQCGEDSLVSLLH